MDIKCPPHKPQIYPSALRFYFSLDSVLLGGVSGSLALSAFFLLSSSPLLRFRFPSERASCFLLTELPVSFSLSQGTRLQRPMQPRSCFCGPRSSERKKTQKHQYHKRKSNQALATNIVSRVVVSVVLSPLKKKRKNTSTTTNGKSSFLSAAPLQRKIYNIEDFWMDARSLHDRNLSKNFLKAIGFDFVFISSGDD